MPRKRGRDANLSSENRDRSRPKIGGDLADRGGNGRGGNLRRGSGDLSTTNSRFEGNDDGGGSDLNSRGGAVRGGMKRGRGWKKKVGGNAEKQPFSAADEEAGGGDSKREEKTVRGFMDLVGKEGAEEAVDRDDIETGPESSVVPRDDKEASVKPTSLVAADSYLSETRFDQCAVSPLTLRGIKDVGFEKMTMVQEATLPFILKGKDVMAKARTGTGKTVAFLLPSIEVVVKSPPADRNGKKPPILVLVVCPTRELATQASVEAKNLLKYHTSIGVQVVIGGTTMSTEQKCIQIKPCQILIATPGRLKDHIENTTGFATRLMGVKVLVLDEADNLLDMGFRKDIERIIAAIPKQRQTLLFSATIPNGVRQIANFALKSDHEFINSVEEGDEDTHKKVKQTHLVAPMEKHFSWLYVMLKKHISDDVKYKVIVFCTTAMVTKLVAEMLGELNLNVREIHSRKSQSHRTKVSDEFRKSKGLILVTSDVSARGVDYPDVTLVIQMGLPSGKEQYIHRLGRTGRKGKEGQGILILAPFESYFLSSITDLPITEGSEPKVNPDTAGKVERAVSKLETRSKEAAYQSWLGYYSWNKKVGKNKVRLVELANEFSRCMGLAQPPAIPRLIVGKMGLRNVQGLLIE